MKMRKKVVLLCACAAVLFNSIQFVQAETSGNSIQDEAEQISHINREYEGKKQPLEIDADVVINTDTVYEGTLTLETPDLEVGKTFYGDKELWEKSTLMEEGEALKYKDKNVYLYATPDGYTFNFDMEKEQKENPAKCSLNEEEARKKAEEAISILKLQAGIIGRYEGEEEQGDYTYMLQGMIETVPIAFLSKVSSNGQIGISGEEYSYIFYNGNMEVKSKKEIELLDFDVIMEKVEAYAKAGYIQMPYSGQKITRISLEYFTEEKNNEISFKPIWNFQVPYLLEQPLLLGRETDDLFYIDAVTGNLLKTMA